MEQKYLVRIKSDVREAEFDVTGENGVCTSVRLKSLRYLKANPNSGHGEVMDAHIYENDDSPMNSICSISGLFCGVVSRRSSKKSKRTCPLLCWKRMWCGTVLRKTKENLKSAIPIRSPTHGVANTQSTQFPRCCSAAKVKWSQKCSIKIWKMSVSSFPNSAERMRSCEAKKSACQKPRYTVE